eukprot:586541-Prorocentrum_minimum.AAC.3
MAPSGDLCPWGCIQQPVGSFLYRQRGRALRSLEFKYVARDRDYFPVDLVATDDPHVPHVMMLSPCCTSTSRGPLFTRDF